MISMSINGFRGIETAFVEASPIALIAGRNEAGKSSICLAVAAALADSPIPYLRPGPKAGDHITMINKSSAGILVRGGSASAEVSVSGGTGKVTARWPQAETEVEGENPPSASVYAAGLIDICRLDPKSRATYLSELLKTEPTREDLAKWLKANEYVWDDDAEPKQNAVSRTWASIEKNGWDATEKMFREQGAKLKGQWETITNERYGSNKAEGWLPDNWNPELESSSLDSLDANVANAKAHLEQSIASQAVDEDRQAAAQRLADTEEPDMKALRVDKAKAAEAVKLAEQHVRESTYGGVQEGFITLPCVHCDEPNALVTDRNESGAATGYRLTAIPERPDPEAEKEAYNEHEALVTRLRWCSQEADKMATAVTRGETLAGDIEKGRLLLKEFRAKTGDEDAVDQAREIVRAAEEERDRFTAWKTASKAHTGICRNKIFIAGIAVDGVRAITLKVALKKFNEGSLGVICKAAGWPLITLDANLEPLSAGVPHILMSTSGQYRTRVALQLAVAGLDGSSMVVIDGADVLDAKGRNGLFKALKSIGSRREFHALVSMTLNKKELMPDLGKAKMGCSYWVEDAACSAAWENKEAA